MQSKNLRTFEQSDVDIDELISWLEIMVTQELDLAPPLGEEKRRHRLKSTAYITLQGEIEPKIKVENIAAKYSKEGLKKSIPNGVDGFDETSIWGYAELVRLGRQIEIATVIIDSNRRGRGHSHHLIEQAIKRWRQDAILHGINPPLSSENRLALFCFTKHVGLATALLRAGFEQRPAVRHWSRLWLRRSSLVLLPFSTQFSLFSDPKRVIHQAKHLSNYQLYTFDDAK
jgi:GNAT superfamily N-acetyltransferase